MEPAVSTFQGHAVQGVQRDLWAANATGGADCAAGAGVATHLRARSAAAASSGGDLPEVRDAVPEISTFNGYSVGSVTWLVP